MEMKSSVRKISPYEGSTKISTPTLIIVRK